MVIGAFSVFVLLLVLSSVRNYNNEKREMAERRQGSRKQNEPPKSAKEQFKDEVKGSLDSNAIRHSRHRRWFGWRLR